MKNHYCLLVIIIMSVFLPADFARAAAKGEGDAGILSERVLPIYPGAKEIRRFCFINGAIREATYKLDAFYPAKEVVDFYEKEMQRQGYKPSIKINKKNIRSPWQTFVDGTKPGQPYVAQLVRYWHAPDRKSEALLILKYHWYGHGTSPIVLEKNKNLSVTFQKMKAAR